MSLFKVYSSKLSAWTNIVKRTASQNITFGPQPIVMEATASSVKIQWDFWDIEDPDEVIKDLFVEYRSENEIENPAMLVSNPNSTYYVAQEAGKYQITPDVGHSGHGAIWTSIHPTHMVITVDKLKLPNSDYRIDLSRTLNDRSVTRTNRPTAITELATVEVVRSSKINLSPLYYPVKTGVGCFRVYEHYMRSRNVKIYWQPIQGLGNLMISIYELHPNRNTKIMVHEQQVSAGKGSIMAIISFERHYVVFQALSETW